MTKIIGVSVLSIILGSVAAVADSCPCDCNDDSSVRVGELTTGVAIGLHRMPVSRCPAADMDSDSEVEINELIRGVDAALRGCEFAPPTPTPRHDRQAFEEARALWTAADIRHYQANYRFGCFCPGPHDIVVEVVDGKVVGARDPSNGDRLNVEAGLPYLSVAEVFDRIEHHLDSAFRLDVSYDDQLGYPTNFVVDPIENLADDELSIQYSNITVVDGGACRNSSDCDPSGGVCVEPGGTVGCGVCFDFSETSCSIDMDCEVGSICKPAGFDSCACDPSLLTCQPGCDSVIQCSPGETCDSDRHCRPIGCREDSRCLANFACNLGDSRTGRCERRTCTSDNDCAVDAGTCVNGRCYETAGSCQLPPP